MKRAPARPFRALGGLLAFASFAAACGAGCQMGREEPEVPPPPCQPGTCPPGQWPTMPPPAADPSPTAAAPGLMPAFLGFPCATTEDLICGWGKCIAGRCGGCQTSLDCKPGGACGWTPIGMACVYGGGTQR